MPVMAALCSWPIITVLRLTFRWAMLYQTEHGRVFYALDTARRRPVRSDGHLREGGVRNHQLRTMGLSFVASRRSRVGSVGGGGGGGGKGGGGKGGGGKDGKDGGYGGGMGGCEGPGTPLASTGRADVSEVTLMRENWLSSARRETTSASADEDAPSPLPSPPSSPQPSSPPPPAPPLPSPPPSPPTRLMHQLDAIAAVSASSSAPASPHPTSCRAASSLQPSPRPSHRSHASPTAARHGAKPRRSAMRPSRRLLGAGAPTSEGAAMSATPSSARLPTALHGVLASLSSRLASSRLLSSRLRSSRLRSADELDRVALPWPTAGSGAAELAESAPNTADEGDEGASSRIWLSASQLGIRPGSLDLGFYVCRWPEHDPSATRSPARVRPERCLIASLIISLRASLIARRSTS